MSSHWYVLRCKPHKETSVWQQTLSRGFDAFYPRLKVKPANPRSRHIRPYFPGYMFVRADLGEVGISVFQWMPNAIGLVCFGGAPARVPDEIVAGIRRRLEQVRAAGGELLHGIRPGDRVSVQDGPFAGYQAIFDTRLGGQDRVRVLLQLLNERCIPLELRAGQIKARRDQLA
jgi:transcription antitermination factor NusG